MKTKSKKIALVVLTAIFAISTFSVILTPVGALIRHLQSRQQAAACTWQAVYTQTLLVLV
jgi:hypothetical protein